MVDENTPETAAEQEGGFVIDPALFKLETETTESSGVKSDQTGAAEKPLETDKSGQYSDHEIAKLINRIAPALINNTILTCPECDKLTAEEVEKSGIGGAVAWYVDKKFPEIPINTPEFAILTAAGALIGYTALHHPVIKSKLQAIETAETVQGTGEKEPSNEQVGA